MRTDLEDAPDLDLIRASAREFLSGRTELDSLAELAKMDWLGLLVDEEYSGAGWRPVEACVIAEELGRARDKSPWSGGVLAAAALAAAPESVRDTWLPDALSGAIACAFAPDADVVRIVGGDVARIVVTVGGEGVRLMELGEVHDRRPDDDSLDIERRVWRVGLPARAGVTIGSPLQAQRLNAAATLLVSADAIGAFSSALARLTAYLKDRIAFGAAIASFQAVQHRLVELLVLEVKARAIVMKAARTLMAADVGVEAGIKAAIAQSAVAHAFVATKMTAAVDECMQLSGGIGFTWEYPLHHELRRAATDASLVGTARSSRALLAEVSGW